jgi:hypothetical protein
MAFNILKERYHSREIQYYRDNYPYFIIATMAIIVLIFFAAVFLVYQLKHQPTPVFYAIQPNGQQRLLTSNEEPNLLPSTILRFASKAAITAYTFSFSNIKANLALSRPYFTTAGWEAYRSSVSAIIDSVMKNQLFVNGIVFGAPVISNQGMLPATGYTWRVQIPLLVVYQSANTTATRKFYVVLTVIKQPTYINPRGIGIDQFVMTNG